jgi:hypothetical protein
LAAADPMASDAGLARPFLTVNNHFGAG